jgi:hypothetical protein
MKIGDWDLDDLYHRVDNLGMMLKHPWHDRTMDPRCPEVVYIVYDPQLERAVYVGCTRQSVTKRLESHRYAANRKFRYDHRNGRTRRGYMMPSYWRQSLGEILISEDTSWEKFDVITLYPCLNADAAEAYCIAALNPMCNVVGRHKKLNTIPYFDWILKDDLTEDLEDLAALARQFVQDWTAKSPPEVIERGVHRMRMALEQQGLLAREQGG